MESSFVLVKTPCVMLPFCVVGLYVNASMDGTVSVVLLTVTETSEVGAACATTIEIKKADRKQSFFIKSKTVQIFNKVNSSHFDLPGNVEAVNALMLLFVRRDVDNYMGVNRDEVVFVAQCGDFLGGVSLPVVRHVGAGGNGFQDAFARAFKFVAGKTPPASGLWLRLGTGNGGR